MSHTNNTLATLLADFGRHLCITGNIGIAIFKTIHFISENKQEEWKIIESLI